ncbi:hypothetical protein LguiA_033595 [Lonicera macranthoides]
METKGRESGSVKLKKPSFPLHPHPINTIPRRRSLGPSTIPVPSSHDCYRQIPNYIKPTKSLNNDTSSKQHSRKIQSTTTTTNNECIHKHALARRRSFDKPPSPSQLPKPLINPNPRELKPQPLSSFKARTTSSLQRPTKEKLSKPSSTLPNSGPEKLLKVTLTLKKSIADRSSKPSNKDIEKPHSGKILSKNGRKSTAITTTTATTTSRGKQNNNTSTNGSVRRARNTSDEFSQMVMDSKLKLQPQDQDPFIVQSENKMVNVDELPIEILILENKGDLDLVSDDHLLNQQEDDQVNPIMLDYQNPHSIIQMDESEELELQEANFSEAKYKDEQGGDIYSKNLKDKENMSYQQETILPNDAIHNNEQKKELESGETSSDEDIKVDTMEENGTIVDQGIKKDEQNSKETEEVKLDEENIHVLAMRQGKKDSPAYNDVIEETANRLRDQRKNKVLALVGAFETVISLEDPMGETSLPK